MRNFALFCRPFWQEKTHRNAQKCAILHMQTHATPPFIIPPSACTQEIAIRNARLAIRSSTPIRPNRKKGCYSSLRSKIASDWRLAILPIFFPRSFEGFWGVGALKKKRERERFLIDAVLARLCCITKVSTYNKGDLALAPLKCAKDLQEASIT